MRGQRKLTNVEGLKPLKKGGQCILRGVLGTSKSLPVGPLICCCVRYCPLLIANMWWHRWESCEYPTTPDAPGSSLALAAYSVRKAVRAKAQERTCKHFGSSLRPLVSMIIAYTRWNSDGAYWRAVKKLCTGLVNSPITASIGINRASIDC
jgi:hypothetical protein